MDRDADRPSTLRWQAPAQRLIRDIADLYSRHGSDHADPYSQTHRDLTDLLRAAHALEVQFAAAASLDSAAARQRLLRLLSPIRSYCALLDDPEDAGISPAFNDHLRGVVLAVEQLTQHLQEDERRLPLPPVNPQEPGRLLLVATDVQRFAPLTRTLRDAGHWLEEISAARLPAVLGDRRVDLVLLDGGAATPAERLLRAIRRHSSLRVLVLEETADLHRGKHWLELGVDDWLAAPHDPPLLQLWVRSALERKRSQDNERRLYQELERSQRFIRRVFGRYLSAEIVDDLLENPQGLNLGGVQRTVTILLADIRGFTTLCEQLAPDRVMKLLNIYLGTMAEIVLAHQGTVDEFIGDAVLAIFGAPVSRHDDTDRALHCALEMQRAVEDINARNLTERLPAIEVGVSLNTGRVVAGNVGSELRSKYAVVGHAVNQVARIEEVCPGSSILISGTTLQAARQLVCVGAASQLDARGMRQPIQLYELLGIQPQRS